jgi:DNA polymerase V
MFALIDCNNFYASCERVFRPDLNGKPIVILSNNDGCVIARSNEAKKLGIPMGAPSFEYEAFFAKNNVVAFSSNYALYGDMSSRVMQILSEYAPEIEIYSIDEAFLKFETNKKIDFEELGNLIRERINKCTGIPVSIGFAPSKALSKLANKIAKKYPNKTDNVYVMDDEPKRIKALQWLKIEDVWGIGSQHAARLKKIGINNAYDFIQLNDTWVKNSMSVVGLRLKYELLGFNSLGIDREKPKQNISVCRSFERNYTSFEEVHERLATFAYTCSEKLRENKQHCLSMMVFIHTNEHRKDLPQYAKNIVLKLLSPSNSGIDLVNLACKGLKLIYKEGYSYKKAGVILMDLSSSNAEQTNLFEMKNPKHPKLMEAMDSLNKRLGKHTVRLATQSIGKIWKMKQEKLSPNYTTKISDIINIKA